MKRAWIISHLLMVTAVTPAGAQDGQVLTLSEALRVARAQAPELTQARAETQSAKARVDIARAPMLPQVSANLGYQRGTGNTPGPATQSFRTHDTFSAGVSASQLIYDFGQSGSTLDAAKARASANEKSEQTSLLQIDLEVRTAYFTAAAAKALASIARETLANEEKHLQQVRAFVEVGTRPAIDLAQARAAVANAKLSVVRSDNAYATSKAALNRAMGASMTFEVGNDVLPAVAGEESPIVVLATEAEKSRPELAALETQIRAQALSVDATEGAYGPSLSANTSLTEGGRKLDDLAWNWNIGLGLTWPIFQGGITDARVREGRATLAALRAQLAVLQKEVRYAVEEAKSSLLGAQAALIAADEVVATTQERLTLAEGRYAAGVGNIIELGDAQLALRDAQGQRVQADYDVASARARLLFALGRP
jgi:outer membrane protein